MNKTSRQEEYDTHIAKDAKQQVFVPIRLCIVLDISIAKYFSYRHQTDVQECHLYSNMNFIYGNTFQTVWKVLHAMDARQKLEKSGRTEPR